MRDVLVVEDQTALREGIVEVISTLGVRVEGCASGEEAIARQPRRECGAAVHAILIRHCKGSINADGRHT